MCARDHASALVVGAVVGEKDVGRFEGWKVGRRGGERGNLREGKWGGGGGERGNLREGRGNLREECGEKGRGKEMI